MRNLNKIFFILIILFFNFDLNAAISSAAKSKDAESVSFIKIKNNADEPIFVCVYHQKGVVANRYKEPTEIQPFKIAKIERPKRLPMFNRRLIFSFNKQDLKENLVGKDYRDSNWIKIGAKFGKNFYIVREGQNLKGYNSAEWNVLSPYQKLLGKTYEVVLQEIRKAVASGPHAKEQATVRLGSDLCEKEKNYLEKRKNFVKNSLEKFLDTKITDAQVPTIAVCCSGGGYRAMNGTAGLMAGAEKIGLLDCVTYATGLSGSTWFLAPWIYSEKTVLGYNKQLQKIVAKDLKATFVDPGVVTLYILKKNLFKQPVTLVDIYGCLLSNKLFNYLNRFKRQSVSLSDLAKKIENGKTILPIMTAVQPGPPYTWFEFSPYEVGGSFINSFVPTWAFGRKFLEGKSQDFGPEISLGYLMGIWGSAFTFSLERGLTEAKGKLPAAVSGFIEKTIEKTGYQQERLSLGKVNNYAYGLNVELGKIDQLNLLDGGMDFNVPFPPLLRPERNVDVIIVCDMSAGAYKGGSEIKKAQDWAKFMGLKFPKINYDIIAKEIVSVFKDETDPTVPTVIYFSLVKNNRFNASFDPIYEIQKGFCGTTNFKYTPKQFKLITGLMAYNVMESKDIIKQELLNKIESKK